MPFILKVVAPGVLALALRVIILELVECAVRALVWRNFRLGKMFVLMLLSSWVHNDVLTLLRRATQVALHGSIWILCLQLLLVVEVPYDTGVDLVLLRERRWLSLVVQRRQRSFALRQVLLGWEARGGHCPW